jgi:CRP-like cAMP-binding protein
MDPQDRLALLRSLELFASIPDARLKVLADLLEILVVENEGRFIVEGEPGDGLYYILSGQVRVAKRLGEGGEKDLAFAGPGECLGEMEMGGRRSASAYANGRVELLRMKSADLKLWFETDPAAAARFMARLLEIQSLRLRRTSDEVALLYDLSELLLTPQTTAWELLSHALDRVTPHLQGRWAAEARAYNQFEGELDLAARQGPAISSDAPERVSPSAPDVAWTDARTLTLMLRTQKRPLGCMRFRCADPLADGSRDEAARTLGTVARLLAPALENIEFRTDEALRERLRTRSYGPRL